MQTYYVSPTGNDSNNGTSESSPWQSISKVNGLTPGPGDQVLFQGGSTFVGNFKWVNKGGTTAAPVIIGSYGTGQATIQGTGASNPIYTFDCGGITVQNLTVIGNMANANGIQLEVDKAGVSYAPVSILNCDVSNVAGAGILLESDVAGGGYTSARITGNTVHDCISTAILTWAPIGPGNMPNVYIANNTVYNNPGKSSMTCSGNGIWTDGLGKGSVIEKNLAYNNGYAGVGGAGIWTSACDSVVMQYNISCANRSLGADGDGFDFDNQTSNSIMQYNYSTDNDGGGLIFCHWGTDQTFTGNVVRFNVTENNCRKSNYGEISLWGMLFNTRIYNNTCFGTKYGNSTMFRITNDTISSNFVNGLYVYNNIFEANGSIGMISIESGMLAGSKNIVFDGNVYHAINGTSSYVWGPKTYTGLPAFQTGTNLEAHGLEEDPMIVSPGNTGATTSLATVGSLQQFAAGYKLQTGSPMIGAGIDLSTVGITNAATDFFGNAVAAKLVGASSATTVIVTPTPTPTPSPSPSPTPTPPPVVTPTAAISGTPIGTTGSFANLGNTIAKVFDGDITTFFDAPVGTGDWVGLDIGTAQAVSKITYAPRPSLASRMVGGVFQGSNDPTFATGVETVYTVTTVPPYALVTANVTSTYGYRYWRYFGPAGGYCNISEMQLTANPTQPSPLIVPANLTGTIIGTVGAWSNQGNTIQKAFTATGFFDGPDASGDWLGMDFGTPVVVMNIGFTPRAGFASRMVGGQFQVANSADFANAVTVYTVATAPAYTPQNITLSNKVAHQYFRYIGAAFSNCNIAGVSFSGYKST
jgi:hypothetical protein